LLVEFHEQEREQAAMALMEVDIRHRQRLGESIPVGEYRRFIGNAPEFESLLARVESAALNAPDEGVDQQKSPDSSIGTQSVGEGSTNTVPTVAPPGTGGLSEFATVGPAKSLLRIPGYEILDEVARGGMGIVYRARQLAANRIVAIKMTLGGEISEDERRRFHVEAEAIGHLDHPNIVPLYNVGEHDGRPFFSMAYIEGSSLKALVADGPLPPRQAAEIMQTVSSAVHFAHSRGIVHRDIKPSNVLLDLQGQPRVTDFGLAKRVRGDVNLTATGDVLGTPSFMPPEQARGEIAAVGPASDVYSLGATLYNLLSGRPPFQAATAVDTLVQVVSEQPASLRQLNANVPIDLDTICFRCLQKVPEARYSSANELAEELGRFLRNEPIRARPASRFERAARWCRRNSAIAGLAGASLLLVVTVAVVSTLAYFRQAALSREIARSAQNEKEQRDAAEQSLGESLFQQARSLSIAREPGWRGKSLKAIEQAVPIRRDEPLRDLALQALASWDWDLQDVEPLPQGTLAVEMAAAGSRLIVLTARRLEMKETRSGRTLGFLEASKEADWACLAAAPDGRFACGDALGRVFLVTANESGELSASLLGAIGIEGESKPPKAVATPVTALAFGPADGLVAATDSSHLAVFSLPKRRVEFREPIEPEREASPAPPDAGVRESPDLEVAGSSQRVTLVTSRSRQMIVAVSSRTQPAAWRLRDGAIERIDLVGKLPQASNPHAAVTKNGKYLILACNEPLWGYELRPAFDPDSATQGQFIEPTAPAAPAPPAAAPAPPPAARLPLEIPGSARSPILAASDRFQYLSDSILDPAADQVRFRPSSDWIEDVLAGPDKLSTADGLVVRELAYLEPVDREQRPYRSTPSSRPKKPTSTPRYSPMTPRQEDGPPPWSVGRSQFTANSLPPAAERDQRPISPVLSGPSRRALVYVFDLDELVLKHAEHGQRVKSLRLGSVAGLSAMENDLFVLTGASGRLSLYRFGPPELELIGTWASPEGPLNRFAVAQGQLSCLLADAGRATQIWTVEGTEQSQYLRTAQAESVLPPDWTRGSFSSDSRHVAVSTWSQPLEIRETLHGTKVAFCPQRYVRDILWLAPRRQLLLITPENDDHQVLSDFRFVRVLAWDRRAQSQQDPKPIEAGPAIDIGFPILSSTASPDGRWMAFAGRNSGIAIWEPSSEPNELDFVEEIGPEHQSVTRLSTDPNGRFLAAAYLDGTIRVWSAGDWSERLKLRTKGVVSELCIAPDGQSLLAATELGQLECWSIADGRQLGSARFDDEILSLAIRADGRSLATGLRSGRITLRTFPDMAPRGDWSEHRTGVNSLKYAADGESLLTCALDGEVRRIRLGRIATRLAETEPSWVRAGEWNATIPPVSNAAHERRLRLESVGGPAEFRMDGLLLPAFEDNVDMSLTPGTHEISVSRDGEVLHSRKLTVPADEPWESTLTFVIGEPSDADRERAAQRIERRVAESVLRLGGTIGVRREQNHDTPHPPAAVAEAPLNPNLESERVEPSPIERVERMGEWPQGRWHVIEIDLEARDSLTDRLLRNIALAGRLETLNLRKTPVTNEAVTSLGRLKSLRKLLIAETGITGAGRTRLAAALPKCEIDVPHAWPFDPPDGREYEWSPPVNLGPEINFATYNYSPRVSDDGLELWFIANGHQEGGEGSDDVWIARRKGIGSPWEKPTNVGKPINTFKEEREFSLTRDRLTLFSKSWDRDGIRVLSRSRATDEWRDLGSVPGLDAGADFPVTSHDGLQLFVSMHREQDSVGGADIYVLTRKTTNDPWSEPKVLPVPVNSADDEWPCWLSPDGAVLGFASTRPGGLGERDLWFAARAQTGGDWQTPTNLGPVINSPGMEPSAHLSSDGMTIWFTGDKRPGQRQVQDIWESRRTVKTGGTSLDGPP
jgi:WD40 repeat protein/predicted Ser/Thr protein kinase